MNTFDAIYSRKSVRSYTGEKVTDEEIKELVKAAYASPVGMGRFENVMLTVITNEEFLAALDKKTAEAFGDPEMHPLYGAPLMILVSAKVNGSPDANAAYSNPAGIVENMALAAVDMGLGTCHIWGAIRVLNESPELLAKLDMPEGFTPCCAGIFGKSDDKYEIREIPEEKIKTVYMK